MSDLGLQLLTSVRQNPDDEAARLVLVDYLLESGDPLGEYLLLAERVFRERIENVADEDVARMNVLLAAHEDEWIGAVADVTTKESRHYVRGFLDACELSVESAIGFESALGAPEWATVRTIARQGKTRPADLLRLLRETSFPVLRSVGSLDAPTLAALLADERTLRRIEEVSFFVMNPQRGQPFPKELLAAFEKSTGLKRLFIGFVRRGKDSEAPSGPNAFSWLWSGGELDVLGVAVPSVRELAAWIRAIESVDRASIRELRLLPPESVGPPAALNDPPGEYLTITRDERGGAFNRLIARSIYKSGRDDSVARAIASLPEGTLVSADLSEMGWDASPILAIEGQTRLESVQIARVQKVATVNDGATRACLDRLRERGVRVE